MGFDKKAYMAEWRKNNNDKMDRQRKAWLIKNGEKHKEYMAAWHQDNKDRVKARHAEWRSKHPDYHSNWKKINAEKVRAYTRNRRVKMKGVLQEPYTLTEIAIRDNWICGICEELVDELLGGHNPKRASVDHIIPISKGGNDTKLNVQIAHFDCNLRKGATYEAP